MSSRSFDHLSGNVSLTPAYLKDIVRVVNNIMRGKINTVGEVTLNTSATTTLVTSIFAGSSSHITFTPLTANAAAEIGSGTMYISDRSKEGFTITHASNTQADRTFTYAVLG